MAHSQLACGSATPCVSLTGPSSGAAYVRGPTLGRVVLEELQGSTRDPSV